MSLLVNLLAAASLALGGSASAADIPGSVRAEAGGFSVYEIATTPTQCAIWRLTNPDLYRKYCL